MRNYNFGLKLRSPIPAQDTSIEDLITQLRFNETVVKMPQTHKTFDVNFKVEAETEIGAKGLSQLVINKIDEIEQCPDLTFEVMAVNGVLLSTDQASLFFCIDLLEIVDSEARVLAKPDFPTLHEDGFQEPMWDSYELSQWLFERGYITSHFVNKALAIKTANHVLECRRLKSLKLSA
ncbi:hypothetical protein [Vibrio barjaei]|uniref:hypothetical protein n=1 Tax=Vibrio barjaei TaxID=1676683 RepID=UPI0022852349|nr:hypothetical protein [Vibrio barjaei]MCY9870341.1 hypothetical protein [Vibrio barjaei]